MEPPVNDWDMLAAAVAVVAYRDIERRGLLAVHIREAVRAAQGPEAAAAFAKHFSERMVALAERREDLADLTLVDAMPLGLVAECLKGIRHAAARLSFLSSLRDHVNPVTLKPEPLITQEQFRELLEAVP